MPPSPTPDIRNKTPRNQRPLLFLLLGVILLFFLSLPWQRQQWDNIRKIKEENALQDARIRDLKTQQSAVQSAQQQVQTGSGDINSRLDAAHTLLSRGDTIGAGKILQQVETEAFGNPGQPVNGALASALAGLFQDAGWIDRALVNAQRAVTASPSDIGALLRLGVIEAQIGWAKESREHIDAAQKLAPDAAEPHLALALLHDQVGAAAQAEKELLLADKLRPRDKSIALLLFRNYMNQQKYDNALRTIRSVMASSPADSALLSAEAEATIEQALSRSPSDTAGLKAGLEMARKLQQLFPESRDAHYLTGKALRGLGDDKGALSEWEITYSLQPGLPNLAINLGRLLIRQGQTERGKKMITDGEKTRSEGADYNRLLIAAGTNRTNTAKHRELAKWCQARGRYSRAILEWDQVLEQVPDDAEAKRERATCLTQRLSPSSSGTPAS